jgi:hypothetical protein
VGAMGWVVCEPFGGVFRNGIGSIMGRLDWIGVLSRIFAGVGGS